MGTTARLQGVKECLYREMPLRQRDHWGSHLWAYLHTITLIDYDDSETNQRMSEPILPVLHLCTFKTPIVSIKKIKKLTHL